MGGGGKISIFNCHSGKKQQFCPPTPNPMFGKLLGVLTTLPLSSEVEWLDVSTETVSNRYSHKPIFLLLLYL